MHSSTNNRRSRSRIVVNQQSTDIAILGAGMVGLALAHQINERYPGLSITVIDKEAEIGMHSSGRNSGVLHAGIITLPVPSRPRYAYKGHDVFALGVRLKDCLFLPAARLLLHSLSRSMISWSCCWSAVLLTGPK